MLLIGDVHGLINDYWKLMQKHKPAESIQLGDFGFQRHHQWFMSNMDIPSHRILFGNHDYMPYVHKAHSLGDYGCVNEHRLFAIRGAHSIDRAQRIEGKDWWPNEELNYAGMSNAVMAYEMYRPEIMISHDCPHEVRKALFGIEQRSATSNGLQACFEIHQPRMWVFGHHHSHRDEVINGTRFVCLAELETLEI